MAGGVKAAECRGLVKGILRDLELKESLKDAVAYLPVGKRDVSGMSDIRYPRQAGNRVV